MPASASGGATATAGALASASPLTHRPAPPPSKSVSPAPSDGDAPVSDAAAHDRLSSQRNSLGTTTTTTTITSTAVAGASAPLSPPLRPCAPPPPSLPLRRQRTHYGERDAPASAVSNARLTTESSCTTQPEWEALSINTSASYGLHTPQAPLASPALSASSLSLRRPMSPRSYSGVSRDDYDDDDDDGEQESEKGRACDDDDDDGMNSRRDLMSTQPPRQADDALSLSNSLLRNTPSDGPRLGGDGSCTDRNTHGGAARPPAAASASVSSLPSPRHMFLGAARKGACSNPVRGVRDAGEPPSDETADRGPSATWWTLRRATSEEHGSDAPFSQAHSAVEEPPRPPPAALPALASSAMSAGDGRRRSAASQPPSASLSFLRTRRSLPSMPHGMDRQASISLELSDDECTASAAARGADAGSPLSASNNDSLPPPGLSPASASGAVSLTSSRATAPLNADPMWGTRNARLDLRLRWGGGSPLHSTDQPHDWGDKRSSRSASTTLAEQPAPHTSERQTSPRQQQQQQQQRRSGDGFFARTKSATHRSGSPSIGSPSRAGAAPSWATTPPRTISSAAFASTTPCVGTAQRQSRSASLHSSRYVFPPRSVGTESLLSPPVTTPPPAMRRALQAVTTTTASSSDAPLNPQLSPIAELPSVAAHTATAETTPATDRRRLSALHAGTHYADDDHHNGSSSCGSVFAGAMRRASFAGSCALSRRTSTDPSRSFGTSVTASTVPPPLLHPLDHRALTPLPSIPSTPRVASGSSGGGCGGEGPAEKCSGHAPEDGTEQPRNPLGTEEEEEEGGRNNAAANRQRSRRRSNSHPSFPDSSSRTAMDEAVGASQPSSRHNTSVSSELSAAHQLSANPPPPPWTPAEALYWMSGQLTRQEQQEMQGYGAVYYCGPAVPPRTACGVTEVGEARRASTPTHPPPLTQQQQQQQSPNVIAPASYFPITLGMHIAFRYEVAEVLGFGTFSVVVRAIDHAAQPFSPERHCALKLIRKEDVYQQAAQDEWAVYERVKACCRWDGGEAGREGQAEWAHHETPPSRRRFSTAAASAQHASAGQWRLSLADQRALAVASVLTPRTRFEYRGYHVFVFPLLGFNVRDVIELQRESMEMAKVDETAHGPADGGGDETETSAGLPAAPSAYPERVTVSVLAQVVHALAFLHNVAHLLHGDLKPENVVFVDRTLGHGAEEGGGSLSLSMSPHHPAEPQQQQQLQHRKQQLSMNGVPFPSVSPLHGTALPPHLHYKSPLSVHSATSEAAGNNGEAVGTAASTPTTSASFNFLYECTAADPKALHSLAARTEEHARAAAAATPASHDLHGSLSLVYSLRSPFQRTPGLTLSRTATLSSQHLGHDTDGHSSEAGTTPLLAVESLGDGLGLLPAYGRPGAAGSSSRVAVIDLGHAKALAPGQTGLAFPLQSPSYRAPEMALRLPYTTAVDMWSLGCLLFELRTGNPLLPSACDDASALAAAVLALGMPDATFLGLVKACWKAYKQRKSTSGSTSHALPSRAAGEARTSLSVYVSEHGGQEPPHAAAADAAAAAPFSATPGEEDALPTEEEVAVEGCWKGFIQVLNSTAGRQRARAETRRRLSTSIYVPPSPTAAPQDDSDSMAAPSAAAAPPPQDAARDDGDAATPTHAAPNVTYYDAAEQCALLRVLFPRGQVDIAEQSMTLAVARALRRPSYSNSSGSSRECSRAPTAPAPSASAAGEAAAAAAHEYVWVDFLLGCLYWDSAERLTAAEAQRHPYTAALFTTDGTRGREKAEETGGEDGEGDEDAARRAVAAAVGGLRTPPDPSLTAEALPHCSGVYYLQHHPLTARLFTEPRQAASKKKRGSHLSLSQLPTRRTSLACAPLALAPAAVVPFCLPSHRRAAPSARAWEEQQQQQQQQSAVVAATAVHPADDSVHTPRRQRVSVFCGGAASPLAEAQQSRSTSTTPCRVDFCNSEDRSSVYASELVTPIPEHGGAEAETQQGGDVMVLRLE